MGQHQKPEAGEIQKEGENDVRKPDPVVDKGSDEETDDGDHQPDNLASPHLLEIRLLPHEGDAIDADNPKDGESDCDYRQQPIHAQQFPKKRIHEIVEILIKRRNAGQQVSSVVVLWVRINRASIGLFNNLTAEHDDDIMADMFHNCKVMRNKEVRKPELIL